MKNITQYSTRILMGFLMTALFSISGTAYAAVTLTPATGGSAISADTTGGAYTSLTGPTITENSVSEIGLGTIILKAPTGFEFRTNNNSVDVNVTHTGSCTGQGNKLVRLNGNSNQNVTPTSSTITVTVSQVSASNTNNPNCKSTLVWSGIAVRPVVGNPLATNQNILNNGTASINNLNQATSFGALNEVVGNPANAAIHASSTTTKSGSSVDLTITVTDVHNNPVADGAPVTINTTLGTVSGSSTTVNGIVTRTLTSQVMGTATLSAEGLSVSGDTTVTFIAGATPVISAHDTVITEATSAAGAVVEYTNPSVTDEDDENVTATCSLPSGSLFPIGDTLVTCNATDIHGTQALPVSFTVRVQDTTAPDITNTPSDMTAEATGPNGAVVTYTNPTASDIVDGSVGVSCDPASGSTLALGTTEVTCTATDSHGNSATSQFSIIVQDTTPPVLTLPNDMTVEATGPSGAPVTFSATAHDVVDGDVAVICEPVSGGTFPLGSTSVNCFASDTSNNITNGTFMISVQDTTPPTITNVPSDMTVEATSPQGAIAIFANPTATDLVDSNVNVTCDHASGDMFSFGHTQVTCTATDSSGNFATSFFDVFVDDTIAPSITIINPQAISYSLHQTVVANYSCNDSGSGVASCVGTSANGSTIDTSSIGTKTFTVNATDVAGNTSNSMITYTVTGYTFGGFGAPLIIAQKDFKKTSTIPVKFVLKNADGSNASAAIAKLTVNGNDAISSGGSNIANIFRYDPSAQQYIYNLSTKPLQIGTNVLSVSLDDGHTYAWTIVIR